MTITTTVPSEEKDKQCNIPSSPIAYISFRSNRYDLVISVSDGMTSLRVLFVYLFCIFVATDARPQGSTRFKKQDADFCKNRTSHMPVSEVRTKCRERRSAMMLLEDGQTLSVCHYRVCKDFNRHRIPKLIKRVFCLEQGCRCGRKGAFQCTQLKENIEVWSAKTIYYTMEVERACVCAGKPTIIREVWTPVNSTVS